ncbi:hypothetical protein DH2020_039870 [Rehmannia glutinosa]|uniref:Uncharacterized protein n=1 Tax=Rehmannia glutinosa TaxID=99300 RepID=A0ABR0UWL2_REHGL
MPQVDPETVADGAAAAAQPTENDVIPDDHAAVDVEPDFPPESFWLSKDAEYDWFDRNAVYERKESTKGNSNSNNTNPSMNNSNSQRSSVNVKSKASIIGLPKTQKVMNSKWRTCKTVNTRLFPKKPESVAKSTVPVAEPGSPKVSCMGRVRSKRGRRRSNSSKTTQKPVEKLKSGGGEKQKTGFYSKVMSLFRSKKGHRNPSRSGSRKVVEDPVAVEPQRKSVSLNARGGEPASEPPGLGGVTRFASGRRSANWAAEDFNQMMMTSEPLDSDRHAGRMSRS